MKHFFYGDIASVDSVLGRDLAEIGHTCHTREGHIEWQGRNYHHLTVSYRTGHRKDYSLTGPGTGKDF